MKNSIRFILLLIPLSIFSQTIDGFVFDEDGPVEGVRIYNKTQVYTTTSDANGKYEITAQVTDSLIISSFLHKEKTITVSSSFIDNAGIIQLEQKATALDEVEINVVIQRIFDSIAYQTRLNEQTKLKISADKLLKSGRLNQPTMNLLVLARAIGVLNDKKAEPLKYISAVDLSTLFKDDNLFTPELLTDDFGIALDQHQLFFEYCSVQELNKALLDTSQKLQVLSLLEKHATSFNALVEEPSKD